MKYCINLDRGLYMPPIKQHQQNAACKRSSWFPNATAGFRLFLPKNAENRLKSKRNKTKNQL